MIKRVIHALVAASVATAVSAGASYSVFTMKKGPIKDSVERYVIAPGEMAMRQLDRTSFKKLHKEVEKEAAAEQKKLEKGPAGDYVEQLEKLPYLYNVGAWAVTGFVICFLGTVWLGVSSLKSAIALGAKVTMLMIFLQGALVFGGVLVWRRLAG